MYLHRTDKGERNLLPFSKGLNKLNKLKELELEPSAGSRLQKKYDSAPHEGESILAAERLNDVPVRNEIPLSEFPDYVQQMIEDCEENESKLANEYHVSVVFVNIPWHINISSSQQLQHMTTAPYTVASLSHNVEFNRFRNIYPCKKTRFYTWLKFSLFMPM